MIKKLCFGILILVVIIAALVGYLVYNANSIVGKFKPDLERIGTTALGSQVHLGELSVSIIPSTRVTVDRVLVGANPPESQGIELKNLDLKVNLRALLSGSLEISELVLDSPALTFVNDGHTVFIEGLPKSKPKASTQAAPDEPRKSESGNTSPPAPPLKISLERFRLLNGAITYKDLSSNKNYAIEKLTVESAVQILPDSVVLPALTVSAQALGKIPLEFGLKDLSFKFASGDVLAKEILASVLKNAIRVEPKLNINTLIGDARISSDGVSLSSLVPAIKEFAPVVEQFGIVGTVNPALNTSFNLKGQPLSYKADGSIVLKGIGATVNGFAVKDLQANLITNVTPTKKSVESSDLALSVNQQQIKGSLKSSFTDADQTARIETLDLNGFEGKTATTATLQLTDTKPFTTNVSAHGLNVGALLSILPGGNKTGFTGTVVAFDLKIGGSLGTTLIQSMRGNANVNFKDGVLPGINIAGQVIRGLANLPFIPGGGLYARVDPQTKAALDSPNTEVKSLTGTFRISEGSLATSDLNMASSIFSLTADGRVGFGGEVNLNANIIFTPGFSAALVASTKELANALDSQKRLVLPLSISGKVPDIMIIPNPEKVIEMATRKAIEKGAGKFLEKALGDKGKGLGGILGF